MNSCKPFCDGQAALTFDERVPSRHLRDVLSEGHKALVFSQFTRFLGLVRQRLDPWWNPAVEAQAIDRAHRIGQTRPVFAYRLIARGTVEEKILDLQARKRDLADAILTPGESLMRTLTESDLRWLLST